MPSFKHKKIIGMIRQMDRVPAEKDDYNEWVGASRHIEFLQQNAETDELVLYASGDYSFIHSIVVPNKYLAGASQDDLLKWSCNPFTNIASYVSGGGRDGMWIERQASNRGSQALDAGTDLIFIRDFEGWSGEGCHYVEVNQEYSHLTETHFRAEEGAYCKFDENGDLRHVVSISQKTDEDDVTLVSFARTELEKYLRVSESSLVRMFDFTLLKRGDFMGWPELPEKIIVEHESLFYRQRHCGDCAYSRGVQILSLARETLGTPPSSHENLDGVAPQQFVSFIAHDWRNDQLTKISTDPEDTTNYFEAKGNKKPFELSPAFFRPEVLSKYKTDREKYTIAERELSCRNAWYMKGYDVNEAGQVHAYICDLRSLPYSEQLHWLSFNESPKTSISERARINDFEGQFLESSPPRLEILSIMDRWMRENVNWWTIREKALFERANTPLTSSKEEWGDAVMDLSKLIIEGFELKALRKELDARKVEYEQKEQSISLLEKILDIQDHNGDPQKLEGMRQAQLIRSKIKGHASEKSAGEISKAALMKHGSFSSHFTSLCTTILEELRLIEDALD